MPRDEILHPLLTRNSKVDRGYHHECTGALLCPAGLAWGDTQYVYDNFELS